MTHDPYRCICDPDNIFEPPDPRPVAVEGCPAHQFRRAAQQLALRLKADAIAATHQADYLCPGEVPHPERGMQPGAAAAEHQARLAAESTTCPICVGSGTYFSEEAGDEGGEIVTCVTCRGSGRLAAEPKETP